MPSPWKAAKPEIHRPAKTLDVAEVRGQFPMAGRDDNV